MTNKQHSPASERNKNSILEILKLEGIRSGSLLEIASGTGQHAAFFAKELNSIIWQPSDYSPMALESIDAYRSESSLPNLLPPKKITTEDPKTWAADKYNNILCCNMIHISSWQSCIGLFELGSNHIFPKGKLIIYGPFFQKDQPTASSNIKFDQSLRERNKAWGIRDLDDVTELSASFGFTLTQIHRMPANNLMVVFELTKGGST